MMITSHVGEDMYVDACIELDKTKKTIQRRRINQHDKRANRDDKN